VIVGLAALLLPRSRISHRNRGFLLALAGAKRMRQIIKILFVVFIFLFFSVLVDVALGLLGFPSHAEEQYAHPPRYRKIIKNIEFDYVFETNSQGLRYEEIPLQKPKGTSRVLVIGDSYVEGHGVSLEETSSAILEHAFHTDGYTIDFINGGLSGTGPLQQAKLLFHVGWKYQPDGLLVCVFPNDIAETPETASTVELDSEPPIQRNRVKTIVYKLWPRAYMLAVKTYRWRYYLRRTKPSDLVLEVSKRAVEVGIPQENIDKWKTHLPEDLVAAANKEAFNGSILSSGLLYQDFWTDGIDLDTERAEAKWKAMSAILREIVNRSRQQGLEVGVVFVPFRAMYDPAQFDEKVRNPWREAGVHLRKEWLFGESELQKRLYVWTCREGLPFLDLTPVFREAVKKEQQLNYVLDGHWTSGGHRIAATAIEKWLKTSNVFSFIRHTQKKEESR
jgi:hypothetical protein